MVYGLILIFIVIVFLEVPGLLREKLWRELIAFLYFFLLVSFLAFCKLLVLKYRARMMELSS